MLNVKKIHNVYTKNKYIHFYILTKCPLENVLFSKLL